MANEYLDLVCHTWCTPWTDKAGTSSDSLNAEGMVISQGFRFPYAAQVGRVRMWLGSSGGDWPLEVGICNLDGTLHPDHTSPLCSEEVAWKATSGTYGDLYDVEFSNPASLAANTIYCLYIKYGTGGTSATTYSWYYYGIDNSAFVGQSADADVYNWKYDGSSWSDLHSSTTSLNLQIFAYQDYKLDFNHCMPTAYSSSNKLTPKSNDTWYAQGVRIMDKGVLQTLAIPAYVSHNTSSYKGFKIRIFGDNGSNEPDLSDLLYSVDVDPTEYTTDDDRGYFKYWDISGSSINVDIGDKLWIVIGSERDSESGSLANSFQWYVSEVQTEDRYGYGDLLYTSNAGTSWTPNASHYIGAFKLYQTVTTALVKAASYHDTPFPSPEEMCLANTGLYYWNSSRIFFQTFTPTTGGTLNFIRLALYQNDTPDAYNVRVYAADANDEPTGDILASTTYDVSEDSIQVGRLGRQNPIQAFMEFDFTSDAAVLSSGVKYGIWMQASTYNFNGIQLLYDDPGEYAGGKGKDSTGGSWWNGIDGNSNSDVAFQVYVEANQQSFLLDSSLCKIKTIDATLSKVFNESIAVDTTLEGTLTDDLTLNSTLTYADNQSRHKLIMSFGQGTPMVSTNIDGGRAMARKSRISRIFLLLDDTGVVGSDTIVDVNIDGTSVFTDQDSRPTIEGGSLIKQCERQAIVKNVDSGAVITVDVDSVASGARKLTVVIELNVATSYTHTIRRVDVLDTGMAVNTVGNYEGFVSGQLQFKIIFDEPMDVSIEPNIVWTPNTMAGTPTIPTGGSWSSTYESGDTYLTPMIDASSSSSYVGIADILIDGCKNVFSEDIESFQFSLNLRGDSLIAWKHDYTNEITNTLELGSNIIIDFMYSFDQVSWSSWTNYVSEIDIDLDDAAIGGTGTEGTKILYVKLRDGAGNIITKSATIVYKLTIGQIVNFEIIPTLKKNFYMLKWDLPTDATNSPVQNFIISLDGTQQAKIDSVYPLNLTCSIDSIAVDDATEKVTYTMTAGTSWGPYGRLFTLSAEDITSDYPVGAPRYDVVGVNSSGEYQVVSGAEGLVSRTPSPWEKEFAKKNLATELLPRQPSLPSGFLPIAYIWISAEYWIQYTSGTEYVEKYLARIYDDNVYELSVDKISCVVNIASSADQQSLTIQTVSVTGLTSTYTYTISQTTSAAVVLTEIQTWSETDGGGTQMTNGSIIRDTDLTNNFVYLKFVKEDE